MARLSLPHAFALICCVSGIDVVRRSSAFAPNCKVVCKLSPSDFAVKMTPEIAAKIIEAEAPVIVEKEGCCLDAYIDSKGYLSVGIGHLVRKNDKGVVVDKVGVKAVGDMISFPVVKSTFISDMKYSAWVTVKKFAVFPKGKKTGPGNEKDGESAIKQWPLCASTVMFHLSYAGAWIWDAPKMRRAAYYNDWAKAADELLDSGYCKQVKEVRCGELVARLRACATENPPPKVWAPQPGGNGLDTPAGKAATSG